MSSEVAQKTLIIAEKPSVAADLARVLGKVKKQGDFYENDKYVIDCAVGHLVELFMPEDIDPKLKRWNIKTLPILPEKFELKPIEKSKQKFNQLKKQLKRKDVGCVVNACDAGREGELIFTYVYELTKCKKPAKRMWMLSMTADAIRDAFNNLRDAESMRPLQDAARCRSESDWLIGINGTRVVTSRLLGSRPGKAATVGRVQTPTLSLVVEREFEIRKFKPTPYWRIEGSFKIASGEYVGVFQRSEFKKDESNTHDRIDRIWDEEDAKAIFERLSDQVLKGDVEESKKRTRQASPRLYDLTSLQREANSRYGFPANKTLRVAQALYEKHKMLTYPRTSSRALPEDYGPTVLDSLQNLSGPYAEHAQNVLNNNWVDTSKKRVFNNKQVSDHFAIIPTNAEPKKLSEDEEKIFDMVARRFIAIFYPSAEFDETTRMTTVEGLQFRTNGKVLVKSGWLSVYGKSGFEKDTLPPITDADGQPPQAELLGAEMFDEATKPPARYSEATLLAAMEGAGKFLEDEELAEAMKETGLGTPATRAQIIEHLLREKYLEREARELLPTVKAENLMEFLKLVKIEDLTSPAMTGEWEHRLHLMEQGKITRKEFMKGICKLTEKMVSQTVDFDEKRDGPTRETDIPSPSDGKPLIETFRAWRSQDDVFSMNRTLAQRRMSEDELKQILKEGQIGPLDGFRSKAGKPFSALLRLNEKLKVEFVFENANKDDDQGADLSEFPVITKDPKTNEAIRETTSAYVWEESKTRISRTILSRSIPQDQFLKMLNEGKTDLLDKFRSKRTGKLFSAHLKLDDERKISFEFAPRAKKTAKKSVKKTAKKASKAAKKATS